MAKRAGDPPSPGTRKPAGAGTGGAPLAKTVHRQPAGGPESVRREAGIPARDATDTTFIEIDARL